MSSAVEVPQGDSHRYAPGRSYLVYNVLLCGVDDMIESFRAYKTLKTHAKGVGWCLYIVDTECLMGVKWYWFKDLMSMFSFILSYPEGKEPK